MALVPFGVLSGAHGRPRSTRFEPPLAASEHGRRQFPRAAIPTSLAQYSRHQMVVFVFYFTGGELLLLVGIRPQMIKFLRLRHPVVDLTLYFKKMPQVVLVGVVVADLMERKQISHCCILHQRKMGITMEN